MLQGDWHLKKELLQAKDATVLPVHKQNPSNNPLTILGDEKAFFQKSTPSNFVKPRR